MREYIAGMIVLYHPNIQETIQNIDTYIDDLNLLIVVDNSDTPSDIKWHLQDRYNNIKYISNKKNLGIARALNIGCDIAMGLNYSWILTMDQDSGFENFSSYLTCFDKLNDTSNIALVAPNPFCKPSEIQTTKTKCSQTTNSLVLTSGNLLSLCCFEKIGGFTEKLFIDEVDHDYCLRANMLGYSIVLFENIALYHHLGDTTNKNNKKLKQHNATRHYYMTRNAFYMAEKYHDIYPKKYSYTKIFYKTLYRKVFRILRKEDDKLQKLLYVAKGFKDFCIKRYGKL